MPGTAASASKAGNFRCVQDAAADGRTISGRFPAGIYTVESVEQFYLLKSLADRYGEKIRLLLRLNSGSQFGVEGDEIREWSVSG